MHTYIHIYIRTWHTCIHPTLNHNMLCIHSMHPYKHIYMAHPYAPIQTYIHGTPVCTHTNIYTWHTGIYPTLKHLYKCTHTYITYIHTWHTCIHQTTKHQNRNETYFSHALRTPVPVQYVCKYMYTYKCMCFRIICEYYTHITYQCASYTKICKRTYAHVDQGQVQVLLNKPVTVCFTQQTCNGRKIRINNYV
jgi:hypothetical protein